MRKLFVGAVVGVLALAVAAVALAVTEQTMTTKFTKNTTKTSVGVDFKTASADPENPKNGQPLAVRRLDLDLPNGTKVTPSTVPACTATDDELQSEGPDACPSNTTVGSGKATAKFHDARLRNVTVVVTAFNGKKGLVLHLDPDVSNSFVLRPKWTGDLTNGPVLRTDVPPNCFPPATPDDNNICRNPNTGEQGEEVILNSFQLKTLAKKKGSGSKQKILIRSPKKCKSTWTFKVKYFYANNTNQTLPYKQACKNG